MFNVSSDTDLSRPQATYLTFVTTGIVGTLFMVFGTLENGLVIYILLRFKQLQCATNFLIGCLAVSDMCILLFGIPFVVISAFYQKWIFGDTGCQFYGFLVSCFSYWSISIICLIAIDRYIIIVHYRKRNKLTKKSARTLVLFTFGMAVIFATCPLPGFGSYALEGIQISCAPHWASGSPTDVGYIWTIFIIFLILPLIVISFAYISILIKVKGANNIVRRPAWIREVRVGIIVFLTVVVFLVAWLPYATISLWRATDRSMKLPMLVETVPPMLAKLSCAWNPLIYVCKNREFRKAFRQLFLRNARPSVHRAQQTASDTTRTASRSSNSNLSSILITKFHSPPLASAVYKQNELYQVYGHQKTINGNAMTSPPIRPVDRRDIEFGKCFIAKEKAIALKAHFFDMIEAADSDTNGVPSRHEEETEKLNGSTYCSISNKFNDGNGNASNRQAEETEVLIVPTYCSFSNDFHDGNGHALAIESFV